MRQPRVNDVHIVNSYSYKVTESVSAHSAELGIVNSFENSVEFTEDNLLNAKAGAHTYYLDRMVTFPKEPFVFPYRNRKEGIIKGQSYSSYSVTVIFCIKHGDNLREYTILGASDSENLRGMKVETEALLELGYLRYEDHPGFNKKL